MKTPTEWGVTMLYSSQPKECIIDKIQKEAYNQAIDDAAKTIDDSRPSFPLIVKQAIVNLKK